MGLLDRDRQKRARDERKRAHALILRAARDLFLEHPYEEVRLDAVSAKAGVKKGIPSLLFESKEGLFLRVFLTDLRGWCERACEALGERRGAGEGAAVAVLAGLLAGHPEFGRLLALLHNALERNLDPATVVEFSTHFRDATGQAGEAIEAVCNGSMKPGAGATCLARLLASASGLFAMTGQSGAMSYLKVRSLWPAAALELPAELERLARAAIE